MRHTEITIALAGLSAALLLTGLPITAHAQGMQPEPNNISSASSKYASTSVFVGGTPIMRVRFGAAGYTPEQRATAIQQRVNRILGHGPIYPSDITVRDIDGQDSAIYVKGHLLFTADSATAHYNQTPAHDLAEKWAATMRRVLPSLTKPN